MSHSILSSVPRYNADRFTWDGNKTGYCDASDLGAPANDHVDDRIWDDSADTGFIVRSPRTGKEILFTHLETIKDADNEVMHWIFMGYGAGDEDFIVKVFND